jgi:hypothetical protein
MSSLYVHLYLTTLHTDVTCAHAFHPVSRLGHATKGIEVSTLDERMGLTLSMLSKVDEQPIRAAHTHQLGDITSLASEEAHRVTNTARTGMIDERFERSEPGHPNMHG